ncbi:MAG TPA: ABC transporter ATP-binding protein [Rectinemataceae bacterium]|nr:ABC transporter ATP-binding protein [Rectinemataceae bacterium]
MAIEAQGLTRRFKGVEALKGIDIALEKGQSFALVGPDGAGKTTAIRILCGLLKPSSGRALVFGSPPKDDRAKRRIGYLSQRFSLYGDLSIDENIAFFAEIHGRRDYEKRRDRLLEFTRLKEFRGRQAGRLSGGMKQKLALACALIHEPELLLMDEPTTGVDPVSRREFWSIVSELIHGGMTVLVTTPYLDEAERCGTVGLLNQGSFLDVDSPSAMKSGFRWKVIEVVCGDTRRAARAIAEGGRLEGVQAFGDRLSVLAGDEAQARSLIAERLGRAGIAAASVRLAAPSLENVFMALLGDKAAKAAGKGATPT